MPISSAASMSGLDFALSQDTSPSSATLIEETM